MSGTRARILSKVRSALRAHERDAVERAALEDRLARPKAGLVPQRGQLDLPGRLALFEKKARGQAASLEHLSDHSEIPTAVSRYLKKENLPARLRLTPDPELEALPWQSETLLTVESGRAQGDDLVSVTGSFAAVAETGTLVLTSGDRAPTTLNFLPDTHIVVLRADQVLGTYEEAIARLRQDYGPGELPRSVNYITGPSRTGDIEQTIQLGAHGPRHLHILLVGDATEKADE